MTKVELQLAQMTAAQFIDLASKQIAVMDEEKINYIIGGTALTGSIRRKSMDLSRVLSDLRKP